MAGTSRPFGLVLFLLLPAVSLAQYNSTFAYTGDDALRSKANVHFSNYGGFTNNLALYNEQVIFPYLPALFYEAAYLIQPANDLANVSLSVIPEGFVNVLFMGRVTGMADVLLFKEALTAPDGGIGLRAGIGYSVLGSTFGLTESTPVIRAGILVNNIRITYAYSFGRRTIIDHQLGIGLKFDW